MKKVFKSITIALCIFFLFSGCSKPIETQEVTLRFVNEKGEVDSPYSISITLIEQPEGQEKVASTLMPMIGGIKNGQLKKHMIIGGTYEIWGEYYGKPFVQRFTVKKNQTTIDIRMNGSGKK